jgi:Flp pilus assembly protein TadD
LTAASPLLRPRDGRADAAPSRAVILAAAAIAAAFVLTRLTNLDVLPVFLDEAIHVDWAFRTAETGRLLGVADGGRHLPIWIYSVAAAPAADPLIAARSCSTAFGFATLAGLVFLGRRLHGSAATGLLAGALYVAAPSALLYDRMALADSLLAALVVWSLAFGERWASTGRLSWGLGLGAVVGAAAITKLYGALLLFVPPGFLASGLGPARPLRRQLPWVSAVALVVGLPLFLDHVSTLGFVRENLWLFRRGPNATVRLARNAGLVALWTVDYLTPVGAIVLAAAVLIGIARGARAGRVLLAVSLGWPAFFIAAGGRDWFPRYLHPALPPLFVLAADGMRLLGSAAGARTGRPWAALAVPAVGLAVFALSAATVDVDLISDPARAALPGLDRFQYVEGWPSGYRLSDMVAFVEGRSRVGPVTVLRELRSGPLLEGLDLYVRGRAGIEIVSTELRPEALHATLERLDGWPGEALLALDQPVEPALVLTLAGTDAGPPVAVFRKPGGRQQLELHRVLGRERSGSVPPAPPQVSAPAIPPMWLMRLRVGWEDDASLCALEDPYLSPEPCRRSLAPGAEPRYHLGRLLIRQERFEEAVAVLEEAIRILPGDLEQHLAHVEALEALGRHAEALESLREAEPEAPGSADLHHRKGFNLARLGRRDEAEAALRRAIDRDRSRAAFRNDLAVVLCGGGRFEPAVHLLREAVRLDPEDAHARYNLAAALTVAGALRGPAPPRSPRP